ncbi:hypothetical protein KXS07_29160 [Inquilinus limosus]|uniref:hypothetical protein n=1 Tax=Inquilinus limosus TaxID=171674 RepID=UPI003F15B0A2
MTELPPDLDIQAYCRGLALQQVEMLSRLAEIGMQLAEGAGARALAAQAAAQAAAEAPEPAETSASAGQDPGLEFARYAHLVRQTLAQRARAARDLCAEDRARAAEREAGRQPRRTRHRNEVWNVLESMILDEVEDPGRATALQAELAERVELLYEDQEVRVEDRPLGAVMAGLACGLGLSEEWSRWSAAWPAEPRPARPSGSPAAIEAERARRRKLVAAMVGRAIAQVSDPARIPGLEAGLAVRLQEPDAVELLDTESSAIAMIHLCRSLGIDPDFDDTG